MAKTQRKCVMCGTVYEHCGHCGAAPQLWKNIFCSENCRDIYDVLNKYDGKLITKEDGIERLKAFDLSVVPKFNDRFKALANELTPKKEVVKKQTKESDETSTEEKPKKKTTRTKTRKNTEEVI
jgi:hypothetical protein